MKPMRTHILAFALFTLPAAAPAQEAAQVFEKASRSIYMVTVTTDDLSVVDVVSQGSAVLIAPGRLVTNCHVVDKGKLVFISRKEDKITERVRVIDRNAQHDLCELDVAQGRTGFDKPVEIAPPDSLRVGDPAYAIGSPRGMELTISDGIVSALREMGPGVKVIQTTAPLSPGSSGGGLFDAKGRLVGITTFVKKDSQNLNFAISSQYIKSQGATVAELAKQRAEREASPLREAAFERAERLRLQEQQGLAERRRQLETQLGPSSSAAAPAGTATAKRRNAKEMAALLAVYEAPSDQRAVRTYERLAKSGELAGLDDEGIVRKVYGTLFAEQTRSQVRWSGSGSLVAQYQLELRRNGEIMYVLPVKSSGQESFDREAQRALGVASPFPVPQENSAFAQVRSTVVDITPQKK